MAGVSDDDRQRVLDELRRRAAAGRLGAADLEERLGRARTATSRDELDRLLDLPDAAAPTSASTAGSPWAPLDPTATPPPSAAPTSAPPPGTATWATVPTSPPPPSGPMPPPGPVTIVPTPTTPPPRGAWPTGMPVGPAPTLPPGPVGEPKRHPVLGLIAVVTVGAASLWGMATLAEDTDDLEDIEDTEGGVSGAPSAEAPAGAEPDTRPDEPSASSTTTGVATTAPAVTGTTLPHLDGWETLVVGVDIQPGLLVANPTDYCGWARMVTEDAGTSAVSRGNGAGVRPVVEVKPDDEVLLARGCGPWVPYESPGAPSTTIRDGDWLVGSDIAPGRYRTDATDPDCYWERASDFTRDLGTLLENNLPDRRKEVTLHDGERFTTYLCGTWTPG
ncbi:MAG TPA: DUF1707 domain-containing protein [Acidimicrobiales bacterium]